MVRAAVKTLPGCDELANEQIVEETFLWVYARPPTAEEIQIAVAVLNDGEDRRQKLEDLFWALLNTPEFLFID